jgi:hypothetical protein
MFTKIAACRATTYGSGMGSKERSDELKRICLRRDWYLSQAEEYESGRPEAGTENGIVAAMRCAEVAANYRRMADDLSVFIDAYKEADAQRSSQSPSAL